MRYTINGLDPAWSSHGFRFELEKKMGMRASLQGVFDIVILTHALTQAFGKINREPGNHRIAHLVYQYLSHRRRPYSTSERRPAPGERSTGHSGATGQDPGSRDDQQLRYHLYAARMAKRGLRATQALRRLRGVAPSTGRQLFTSVFARVIDYGSWYGLPVLRRRWSPRDGAAM